LIVRVGLTTVAPDESSTNVFVGGGDLGFVLNVDNNTQLGLNFAYFVTDNWNIEVLAATPFKHDVNVNANPLGLEKLGEVTHLPPTVTANYFFADSVAAFQTYVGVGLNYTIFFDEEFTSANEGLGFSDLDLDASFGISAQVGFDYMIDKKWFVNASAHYIDISTDATFTLNNTAPGADNAPGNVTLDIDPWVYAVSLGYKF
jgi:outer membrane protein